MLLDEESSSIKRRRVARACDSCRRKKVRCDGVQAGSDPPSCTNCRTYGYECSFIDAPKKRGPPKGYIEALETRLQRMESVLGNLVQSGDLPENAISSSLEWINVNESNFRSSQSLVTKSLSSKKSYDFSIPRTALPSNSKSSTNIVKHNKSLCDSDTENASSSDNDPVCDLSDSFGQLTIDDEGHTRYLGYSSGYFTYIKVFRITSDAEFLHVPNYNIRLPSVKTATQKAISELPPKELCEQLLDVFWKYIHPYLVVVDKLDFLEKYNDLENNYTTIILLYAMFANASLTLDIPDVHKDPNDPSSVGREYFDRARELLKNEFDNVSLTIVQALILLSTYHRSAEDSVTWLYCGMAIRTAQEMGLHRNPVKWGFNARQIEIRKRVWWACVICDITTSASLGRPLAIYEIDCDVDYPTPGIIPDEPRHFVEKWIELIKIIMILGRVVTHIYSTKSRQTLNNNNNNNILASLDAELTEWRENLPSELQYDSAAPYNIIDSRQMHIHVLYYACQILLHRPHIRGPKSKASLSIPSLTICTMAANNITHIIHRLMKIGLLKASLPLLIHSFLSASIIHIINVLSDDDRFREVAKHGIRMTLNCLNYAKTFWTKAVNCEHLIKSLLRAKNITIDGVDGISDNVRMETTPHSQYFKSIPRVPAVSDKSHNTFSPSQIPSQTEPMHIINQPTSTVANTHDVRDCNNTQSVNPPLTGYERISSPGSPSNSRFTRFNEFPMNVNNGLFSQNTDSFTSDVSPLLFGDHDDSISENDSFLPFPSTNDLNEWTNWTKYMIRLQTLKTSNTNNNLIPSQDILTSSDSNISSSSAKSMFASMTSSRDHMDYNKR